MKAHASILLLGLSLLCPSMPARTYEAQIIRDAYGVPHIHATSEADAAFALGQMHCEDRLSQLLYCLHAGAGRLTELNGERLMEADIQQRKHRHLDMARQDFPKLPLALQEMLIGYVDGINAWIREHPDRLPHPMPPFTVYDSMAWHRQLMLMSSDGIGQMDANQPVNEKHPGIPPGKSNSWTVDGTKTVTGSPLLLIDPHWPADNHLALYEVRLQGGKLDIWGYGLVGTPVIGLGANPHVAWTFTSGGADSTDAYALTFDPQKPDFYILDGKSVPLKIKTEIFHVLTKTGTETRQATLYYSCHGAVSTNKAGQPYATYHGAEQHAQALEQAYLMNVASSTKEFRQALAKDRFSYFNVVWATQEGDIGYVQTGEVPKRSGAYNYDLRLPGWKSDALPDGKVSWWDLPRVENPATHFIQNCNVAANVVTPGLSFVQADFPPGALYGHYQSYRARGSRATELLSKAQKLDYEKARQIAFDTYVPPADLWLPILEKGLRAEKELPEEVKKAGRILSQWNRKADINSVGATLFRFWRLACETLPGREVGRDALRVRHTPENERDAVQALKIAVEDLQKRYGKIEIPWGEIKRLRRGNLEWPLSGDGLGRLGLDTLRATAADTFSPDNKLIFNGGQSTMGLVFLGEKPLIYAVTAFGQSFDPNSPHYADQARLFSEHRMRPVAWSLEEVEAQSTETKWVRGTASRVLPKAISPKGKGS